MQTQGYHKTLRDPAAATFRADVMIVRAAKTGEARKVLVRVSDGSFRRLDAFPATQPAAGGLN